MAACLRSCFPGCTGLEGKTDRSPWLPLLSCVGTDTTRRHCVCSEPGYPAGASWLRAAAQGGTAPWGEGEGAGNFHDTRLLFSALDK